MCGIFLSLNAAEVISPELLALLQHRGPDSTAKQHREIEATNGESIHLTALSTVLALRGDRVVVQPLSTSDDGSLLCWNGEAWLIDGSKPDGNDTERIFQLFASITNEDSSPEEAVVHRLAQVAGPYAFVFYNAESKTLFFGRDFLGRRSLLWSTNGSDLLLTSVTNANSNRKWHELQADGIYSIHVAEQDPTEGLSMGQFKVNRNALPTINSMQNGHNRSVREQVIPSLSQYETPAPERVNVLSEHSQSVDILEEILRASLILRTTDIPSPPRYANALNTDYFRRFAILFSGGLDCALLARLAHDIVPQCQSVDLLNVAFENPRVHKNVSREEAYELCPDRITGRASTKELREVCPDRVWRFVAINVAYDETRQHRERVLELMQPHNTEMDLSISFALYFAARGIGMAHDTEDGKAFSYTTPARVLLSGLGADELFAGYTRHATAFRRSGRQGLLDELALDIGRLGKRNLGRDDRVISHWAKEARFPYLDEAFIAKALSLPVEDKCDFGAETVAGVHEDGRHLEPGKKVLRCLAWKLGMKKLAAEKKRAIQFGARTAKMEVGNTKGTAVIS